jgi:diguanylate cyclase (GGDEF)-like protein
MFTDEQAVLDNAMEYIKHFNKDESEYSETEQKFAALAAEYGSLLEQMCSIADMTDKAITDLLENSFHLKDRVYVDSLTGVYNRRYMEETLDYSIKTMSRFGGLLTIILLDIDFFKKYNDTYGHNEGDTCLREVAQSLTDCITREADFVARYGGEEFMVVLPYIDEAGARIMCERLLGSIESRRIPHRSSDIADYVTFSIGVTTIKVDYRHTVKEYIECADKALYESKANGRNRYTFAKFPEPGSENTAV